MSDASFAPLLEPSSESPTNLTDVAGGVVPISVQALARPWPAKSFMVSAPPWSVAISLIYLIGLIGTGIYFFLSLVLTN